VARVHWTIGSLVGELGKAAQSQQQTTMLSSTTIPNNVDQQHCHHAPLSIQYLCFSSWHSLSLLLSHFCLKKHMHFHAMASMNLPRQCVHRMVIVLPLMCAPVTRDIAPVSQVQQQRNNARGLCL